MNAGTIITALWALIIGVSLITWIISMRQKIKRAEQFRQGVVVLLQKGVVPGMDRVRHQETDDGCVVAFEGSYGPTGPRHEASLTTTKSGRNDWKYGSVVQATGVSNT